MVNYKEKKGSDTNNISSILFTHLKFPAAAVPGDSPGTGKGELAFLFTDRNQVAYGFV